MVSVIKFPEIPTIPVAGDFQSYLVAPKGKNKIDTALNTIIETFESEQFRSAAFAARMISSAFSINRNALPTGASVEVVNGAKEASSIAGTISDAFTILNGAGAVASLIRNMRKKNVKKEDQPIRKLEMFRSFIQIITTVTSFLTILDRFKVIELANITKQMGTIPVIGEGLARALPASVVFSVFGIISSEITIIISLLKIQKSKAGVDRATAKIKQAWNKPVDADFAHKRIEHIVYKQEDALKKAEKIKGEIEKMEPVLKAHEQKYEEKKEALQKVKDQLKTANKVSKFAGSLKEKIAFKHAKKEYKHEIKHYKKFIKEMKTLETTHHIRTEKVEKWEAIEKKFIDGTLSESEKADLEKMRAGKTAKWKAKKINHYWDIAKEVTVIALALISIAVSITSIALVIIFSGNAPAAALIAMTSIGLGLAAVSLMRSFYFKRIKKAPVNPVPVPDFRKIVKAEV